MTQTSKTNVSDTQLGRELRKRGLSAEDVRRIVDGEAPKASQSVKAASVKKADFLTDVIIPGAQRRERNRALAASMRANGQNPSDPKAWAAAKKAAGF